MSMGKERFVPFLHRQLPPSVRPVQPRDTFSNLECPVEVCGERACKWVSLLLCLWLLGFMYFHANLHPAINNELNIVELLTHLYHIFIFLLSTATCALLLMSHLFGDIYLSLNFRLVDYPTTDGFLMDSRIDKVL